MPNYVMNVVRMEGIASLPLFTEDESKNFYFNKLSTELSGENQLRFTTAWCPPESVIAALAKRYPHAYIEHWWANEDMGSNSGYARYTNGEVQETFYYENGSSDEYETYTFCWGESPCLYQDKDGIWHRKDCGECCGCD
ncbi:MAG: hypothetical protein HFE91_10695 [Acutalibacter sp.]|uniref:DUF1281 family ferredoxin-like fold protein n=1 Tax=Acutalibacter sp. TaxID=1918636 RepID=UPI0021706EAA|nr:hypothetical protein [Acutalibacter sp.]MCI9225917.1 hypothetical protein [Acutalibacter sp.]